MLALLIVISIFTVLPITANAYGDYTDKETGAPVTALWVEQHTRLEALMKQYNEKFNK